MNNLKTTDNYWDQYDSTITDFCFKNIGPIVNKSNNVIDIIIGEDLEWCGSQGIIFLINQLIISENDHIQNEIKYNNIENDLKYEKLNNIKLREQIIDIKKNHYDQIWNLEECIAKMEHKLKKDSIEVIDENENNIDSITNNTTINNNSNITSYNTTTDNSIITYNCNDITSNSDNNTTNNNNNNNNDDNNSINKKIINTCQYNKINNNINNKMIDHNSKQKIKGLNHFNYISTDKENITI